MFSASSCTITEGGRRLTMSSSEDESTSDKGGSPNTQPEKSKKGSTSAKVNSGTKLFGQRKYSNSAINRFANGGPPPGVGAAKRHLDKDLTDEEDGNGSQGGGQPRSKKKKNQNDDLDDLSSQGAGTPPLTFSNNSCMLFIVLGGGVTPNTLFTRFVYRRFTSGAWQQSWPQAQLELDQWAKHFKCKKPEDRWRTLRLAAKQ